MKSFTQNHKIITTIKIRKDAGVLNVDTVDQGLGLFFHTGVLLYPSKKSHIKQDIIHKELDERGGKKKSFTIIVDLK